MKVVLDTNTLISGVFFTGPPFQVLDAWRSGRIHLLVSQEILDEYRRVGEELAERFHDVDMAQFLQLVTIRSKVVQAPPLPERVCSDPDDDKFLSCALAGRSKLVVSGDRQLRKVSGYRGVRVVTPREFVEEYLR